MPQEEVIQTAASFHQVDAPGREPGMRWVAELVEASGMATVPLCVAWLTDWHPIGPVCLDFVIVPFPEDRRRGYGTRLVAACRQRWPGLDYTDPVTPEGEGFYASLPEPAE